VSTGVTQLSDKNSGMTVSFSLNGANAASAEYADGYVVFRNGHSKGHLVHRPTANGTEDYLEFTQPPAAAQVSYTLSLLTGVSGLRLIENTLEFLDPQGVPRLRLRRPSIIDSTGAVNDGTLTVTGCLVDTNTDLPMGRPLKAPGASACTVT
jgi:hypothetical protein